MNEYHESRLMDATIHFAEGRYGDAMYVASHVCVSAFLQDDKVTEEDAQKLILEASRLAQGKPEHMARLRELEKEKPMIKNCLESVIDLPEFYD